MSENINEDTITTGSKRTDNLLRPLNQYYLSTNIDKLPGSITIPASVFMSYTELCKLGNDYILSLAEEFKKFVTEEYSIGKCCAENYEEMHSNIKRLKGVLVVPVDKMSRFIDLVVEEYGIYTKSEIRRMLEAGAIKIRYKTKYDMFLNIFDEKCEITLKIKGNTVYSEGYEETEAEIYNAFMEWLGNPDLSGLCYKYDVVFRIGKGYDSVFCVEYGKNFWTYPWPDIAIKKFYDKINRKLK